MSSVENGTSDTIASATADGESAQKEGQLPVEFSVGTRVNRFVVLERLGQGGMGVVYKAYDPDLDRRIALKFLTAAPSNKESESSSQTRLLREAQALARLSHPNVVAVFDVGVFEAHVFMAMEYVEGLTLRQWVAEVRPTPKQVLEVLIPAGRGLSAAHMAGLIHRDFKPDNVLIGSDGRVRVLDFGLARAKGVDEPCASPCPDEASASQPCESNKVEPSEKLSKSSDSLLNTPMTRAGAVVGTPVYMSPEQHLGQEVDAAMDQYSFCATLYEALSGQRAFSGKSFEELRTNITTGRMNLPLEPSDVPDWILAIIKKGLSLNPEDRYPDMSSLLAELENDPVEQRLKLRSARRRTMWGAIGGLGAGFSVFLGWFFLIAKPELCQGGQTKVASVWNEEIRARIQRSFLGTGSADAQWTFGAVNTSVGAYLTEWSGMYSEACEATRVRGEQSEELLDLRVICMERKLGELKALLEVFVDADVDLLERALLAVNKLSGVSACGNTEALKQAALSIEPLADTNQKQQVDAVREQLQRLDALVKTGRTEQGLALAKSCVEAAHRTGYRPIEAESLYAMANLQERLGNWQEAEGFLDEGLYLADASGYDEYRVKTSNLYSYLLGCRFQKFDEARRMGRQARGAIERIAGSDELLAEWYNNQGLVQYQAGQLDQALEHFESAQKICLKLYGEDHIRVASNLNNLGMIYNDRGEYVQAIAAYQRALKIWEKKLGPDNLYITTSLLNIGIAYQGEGDYASSINYFTRSIDLRVKNQGAQHPLLASMHSDLGYSYIHMQEEQLAKKQFEEALAILKQHPSEAQKAAKPLIGLGQIALSEHRMEDASQYFHKAFRLCQQESCPASDTAEAEFGLAQFLWTEGKNRARARELAQQARDNFRQPPNRHKNREGAKEVERWLGSHEMK